MNEKFTTQQTIPDADFGRKILLIALHKLVGTKTVTVTLEDIEKFNADAGKDDTLAMYYHVHDTTVDVAVIPTAEARQRQALFMAKEGTPQ